MPKKNITVIKEDENGIVTELREGDCAETTLDKLKLEPTQFVKEVTRKLKRPKE